MMQKKLISGVIAMSMTICLLVACGRQATDAGGEAPAEEQVAETTENSGGSSSESYGHQL